MLPQRREQVCLLVNILDTWDVLFDAGWRGSGEGEGCGAERQPAGGAVRQDQGRRRDKRLPAAPAGPGEHCCAFMFVHLTRLQRFLLYFSRRLCCGLVETETCHCNVLNEARFDRQLQCPSMLQAASKTQEAIKSAPKTKGVSFDPRSMGSLMHTVASVRIHAFELCLQRPIP